MSTDPREAARNIVALAELKNGPSVVSIMRAELVARALLAGSSPAVPSPTGTELALDEAKRHIALLTKFWMDSDGWHKTSEDARAFIGGVPTSPTPPVREAALRAALEKIASYGNTDRRVTDPESGAESSAIKLSATGHLKCRLIAQAALAEGGSNDPISDD